MTSKRSKKGYDFEPLTYEVLGACIEVQRQLGRHCREIDYQRALRIEFKKRGIRSVREHKIPIKYDDEIITKRRADFLIWDEDDEILLETKARSEILDQDIEQCLLYLKNGGYETCLLVNFGEKPIGRQRIVYTHGE